MQNVTAIILAAVTGQPIHQISGDRYYAADGTEIVLSSAQQRAIAPLLAEGVPEWSGDASYHAACIWERKRRNRVIVPDGDDALLLMQAVADCHAAIKAIAVADAPARDAAIARNDALLSSVPGVAAHGAAYQAVVALSGEARPSGYLALVAAFDAALAG